jgi:aminopeptidase N
VGINERALDKDHFFSQTNPDLDTAFDVLHYRIEITIPLITNALTGIVKLTCQSLTDDLDQISLNTDPTMAVLAVYKGVEKITPCYNSANYELLLPFEQAVALDDTFMITIHYTAADNNYGFYNYEMSAYTDWAAGWFPCHDIPSDKATYDLHITVPYGVEVASVGLLEDRVISGDGLWETYNWRTDYPVATHLVGMMMSRYYALWSDWYITLTGDSLEVAYYIFDRDSADARQDFVHIVDAIEFYSDLFGPYPFEKYGMAEVEPLYYGAMEYQSMSMISSNWIRGNLTAEDGLVHELAHQWWGDAVGIEDWPSLWLSEGFAEYTAALYTEYRYGDEAFKALMAAKRDRYLQQSETQDYNISDPIFDRSHINIVYKKGAWVLHMLRYVVGTDNLWLILQNYFDAYKYSNATITDFRTAAEEVYGSGLAWFFDEWIYEKGYPRISAAHVINIVTTVWLSTASQTYTFLMPFEPQQLVLDPNDRVLMETESNSLEIQEQPIIADRFRLESNYPNPFNSTTTLRFELPAATEVVLNIYDLSGREIVRLIDRNLEAGYHQYIWNARDAHGRELPTGIYIARMMVQGSTKSIKIMLLK